MLLICNVLATEPAIEGASLSGAEMKPPKLEPDNPGERKSLAFFIFDLGFQGCNFIWRLQITFEANYAV